MRPRTALRFLTPLLLPLVLSACIEFEQTIEIGESGAGRMVIRYSAPTAAVRMLEGMSKGRDGAIPLRFDEAGIRQAFADPAVSELEVELDRGEERTNARVAFRFSSVAAIAGKPFLGGLALTRDAERNRLRVSWQSPLAVVREAPDASDSFLELARSQLGMMTDGAKATFTVTLPDREAESATVPVREILETGFDLTFPGAGRRDRLLREIEALSKRIRSAGLRAAREIEGATTPEERAAAEKRSSATLEGLQAELASLSSRVEELLRATK